MLTVLALKTVIGSGLGLDVWHVVADSRDIVLDIENDDVAALDRALAIVAEAHICSSERGVDELPSILSRRKWMKTGAW